MPINYKNYPSNWLTEIRPAVLERDRNCCKFCLVPNNAIICRGTWQGVEVYQDDEGAIYSAKDGEYLGSAYLGEVFTTEAGRATRIVLTVAHLDRDVKNNDLENLAALCQRCHLLYDKDQHRAGTRETNRKKKGLQNLF